MSKAKFLNVRELTYIALFSALMAVCAWISVPATVSFTLHTFAVFAAVGLLGTKRGTIAIGVYILLGCIGLPVFSGFRGGIGVLAGNTGGYIIGFIFSALVSGLLIHRFGGKMLSLFLSMLAGLVVCYLFGTAWFMLLYTKNTGAIGIVSVLAKCVFPFIPLDLAKIALAALLTQKLKRYIRL